MQKGFTLLLMALYALFYLIPSITSAQQTVGLFTKNNGEEDGYVLFSPNSSKYTYMIDKCGRLAHKWNTGYAPGLDAYLLPNGNLLSTGKISNLYFNNPGSVGGLLQIFNWSGKLIWNYAISDTRQMQNHDVYPMANGNILVMEWERFTAAEAIAVGRDSVKLKGSDVWSIKVQEIKPVNSGDTQVVWQWRLWDHLIQDEDSKKPNYGIVSEHPELMNINYADTTVNAYGSADWTHGNAVTYNADLDQVMISSRNMSEIYIIDHSTTSAEASAHTGGNRNKGGDFLYRWGNPAAYNRGTAKDRRLFVQHNASWIQDGFPGAGNISVFNDGMGRPTGNYSSADLIVPPVDANGNYNIATGKPYGPDSAYWSYTAPNPTDFYSTVQGGAEVLRNGNVLICEATKGNFFEVDSNKNLLWRYVNPDGGYGAVAQGQNPPNIACFKAVEYTEDYSAFNNITLKPGDPIEDNPYPSSYDCIMPYIYYTTPLYKISQLKGYDPTTGIADSVNAGQGFIKGVVECQNLGKGNIQYSILDSTGAITIIDNKNEYQPIISDSVMVGGKVIQSNGLTEYLADTIIYLGLSRWQKQPDAIAKLGESTESDLVQLKNFWMVDTTEWTRNGKYGFDVHITNGKDTILMFVSINTDLYNMRVPKEEFNVTGIEIQNQPNKPYFGDYIIEPRGSFDFERVEQLYKIIQLRGENPQSGIADSAGSRNDFFLKGVVQSPNFNATGLNFALSDSTGSIIIDSKTGINEYVPNIGDSIEISGLLVQKNGLIEVSPDTIFKLKTAPSQIAAINVNSLTEPMEAKLIKLTGYHLTDTAQWNPNTDGFDVNITNGNDTFLMHVGSGTDLFNMSALQGTYDIEGIEIQDQPNAPYFGNYEIEPRGFFDIQKYTPLYKISQVRPQNPVSGIADSAGSQYPFFLRGVVQSPDFITSGLNFSIRDNTGSIIIVADSNVSGYDPEIDDVIQLRGHLIQKNGLTEVVTDSISPLRKSTLKIDPTNVSILDEPHEAKLVKLNGYYLIDTSQWMPNGDGFNVTITNGIDTTIMYIASATDLFKMDALTGPFNVTGIEIQNKSTSPYFGNYAIEPRGLLDIERYTQLYKISQVRPQDPSTGIADSAGSNYPFYLIGIVQSLNYSSSGLYFSLMDNTGSIMVIADQDIDKYSPNIGDSIELKGLLRQDKGLTEVVTDSIELLKKSGISISPQIVPILSESYEAHLVKLNGYQLTDTMQWRPSGNGFSVQISNGTDTAMMYISSATDLFKLSSLKGPFNVTGIEIQDQPNSPYFGNYEIAPRGLFDVQGYLQLYKISQLRGQDPGTGIADSAGSQHPFLLKGIVQSPDFVNSGYDFSIKDSTGSIFVEAVAQLNNYTPNVGDSIEIRGLLSQANGVISVEIDSIATLMPSLALQTPLTVNALNETTEASLVEFNDARLIDPKQWLPAGSGFSVDITNEMDTIRLYISSATNVFGMSPPKGIFNVTGIGSQDKPSSPYLGNYILLPRNITDFTILPTPLYKIRQVKGYNAMTGTADSINTYCLLKGIVQSPNLSGNNSIFFTIQDSTGGITLTSNIVLNGYQPFIGDSIITSGTVFQKNGLTCFAFDSIKKLQSGSEISPLFAAYPDENSESELINLKNFSLVDPTKWDTTGAQGSFTVQAINGTDTIHMKIVSGTDLYSNAARPVWNVFDLTGIGSQSDITKPYLSGYYVIPRSISDITHSSAVAIENSESHRIELYPNPATGLITILADHILLTQIQITDIVGKVLITQSDLDSDSYQFDISSLKKGIYFVQVFQGNQMETVKLVKE